MYMEAIIRAEKRRIWNMNYKRWTRTDPLFSMKYELCYSYVYDSMPGGWYLKPVSYTHLTLPTTPYV